MKKYIYILFASLGLLTSCEEDVVIFDGENGQTVVQFGQSSANLAITIDATGSIDVPVDVTTVSDSERTFNVRVVEDATTADPGSYSFGSIVVPAGEYNGVLTIDGVDNNVETTPESLVLEIVEGSDYTVEGQLNVSVFQVCPVEDGTFTGMYTITVDTPGLFGCGVFPDGGVVELSVGDSPLERTFNAEYILDCAFGSFPTDFSFTMVCNEIIFTTVDTGVGCAGNDVNLVVGPGATAGTYDFTDDSSFTVIVTDNVESDCGGGPVQTSYTFTKM